MARQDFLQSVELTRSRAVPYYGRNFRKFTYLHSGVSCGPVVAAVIQALFHCLYTGCGSLSSKSSPRYIIHIAAHIMCPATVQVLCAISYSNSKPFRVGPTICLSLKTCIRHPSAT
ncbi:hypothetical protein K438DRAFT_924157 [Mycena galopus ATCC 62051]|nr:hypothetical protein K438DRAFT_924157 [Mycena galopus ATCC 62051]